MSQNAKRGKGRFGIFETMETRMSAIEDFGATQDIAITILVDNRSDLLAESTETVKRFTDAPLLAEHGFAALVHLKSSDVKILWDAGVTRVALPENLRRMEIDPATFDMIALSHGHGDHTAAMGDVLQMMNLKPQPRRWEATATLDEMTRWATGRRISIIAHPAAFRERWNFANDGTRRGPVQPPPRGGWEALGAQVVLSEQPYQLAPGVWTTGAVPRRSFETAGVSATLRYRAGDEFLPDQIEDDQAIVLNVKDKGLIILSGCAHSGIVNTVNYARAISGVDKVWAIVGGFHLGRAKDDEIQRTISEIKNHPPKMIVPTHCTGFAAMAQFAAQMPDAFSQSLVGTTYLF
jgi:7,8-dihydropterin-6-yl-methyl-4-(beta-D-ribofuranosyl)aminobenzene 5'-phosphate synthase